MVESTGKMTMFSIVKKRGPSLQTEWHRALTADGIHVSQLRSEGSVDLQGQVLGGLMTQLYDDGFAIDREHTSELQSL